MALSDMIYKLRTNAKLSQAELAVILDVSPQAVQKWESGASTPELEKIIKIAKRFGISLDALVMGRDSRMVEELSYNKKFTPKYANLHDWEVYSQGLDVEYRQAVDEGLDVLEYGELFRAVSAMPKGENRENIADVLFNIICNAKTVSKYEYHEPSDLEDIKSLRVPYCFDGTIPTDDVLKDKFYGAWLGRVCGCLLGKPIEGITKKELSVLLKSSGNSPMNRYILSTDLSEEMYNTFNFDLRNRCYADTVSFAPSDDDTNYTVLSQQIIEKYGKDFTPYDVSMAWVASQPKGVYCTAERVAFCNFVKGIEPRESAIYKNPYREFIGAQIRADYYGYINVGNPEFAADMAYRDACIAQVKNGIYGGMFVSATLACAGTTDSVLDAIKGGLAQIPASSRLYKKLNEVIKWYQNGVSAEDCIKKIHSEFKETNFYHWCHTIPNAMIVVASLLYGNGDYEKSICMAVEACFDTDCNGATVGSIVGMLKGSFCISEKWSALINDKLETTIFGVGTVSIRECAEKTYEHYKRLITE